MDGTLLDDEKRIGPGFDLVLTAMAERGIQLVAASGRQYATLHRQLDRPGLLYIAENGAWVLRDGEVISRDGLDRDAAMRTVEIARARVARGADAGTVLCGTSSAYVERSDKKFLAQTGPYYALLTVVEDLTTVQDDLLKIAVYDFTGSASAAPDFAGIGDDAKLVVSGQHWLDVGSPTADKGRALRELQENLGLGPQHTMVFGDYLNDLGMLAQARWSVAMDNAHPQVRAAAAYVAPSNNDNGVLRTLAAAMGVPLG
ncbi:MAG: HAD family hydrolase [Actinobacteria bacterium]|nr:HAD family hydrolase [Actinomycetota bacterium]